MRNFLLLLAFVLLYSGAVFSQAAINTDGTTPDNSAMLDVKSTTKGFLPPRVALTAVNVASPVTSPATGLLVYNTATAGTAPNNVVPGNYYWNGTRWIAVTPPVGTSAGDMLYWNGTQWVRVPVGTTGQVLKLSGTVPTWGSSATAAIVNTNSVTNISSVSATGGGNITDGGSPVTARGVCWSTVANPTIADPKTTDGVGSGSFTSNITGLSQNTTYHVRAYATNSVGTSYGSDVTFATINIVTTAATAITVTTATSGGTISSDGGNPITARGVCWNTITQPTIANSKTTNGSGTGTFTSNLTGLTGNTLYYVRAYITNSSGTSYGNEITLTTSPVVPTVSSADTSNVTKYTAMCGGTITNDNGSSISARGVCWNTSGSPTIANSKTNDGTGSGSFASTMTGLNENTWYCYRAYATNSAGTGYGSDRWFNTRATLPTVTTDQITGITTTTAIALGTVTNGGYPALTERGVCYGTSPNPTISNIKLACGSGTGAFVGALTNLIPNTTYHLRVYATSDRGTVYGADLTFMTLSAYYAGFETGLPAGWTGNWALSTDSPYHGYYCLKSVNTGDTIRFTKTITTPSGGQISWFHKSDDGWSGSSTDTQFYIDNIFQGNTGDEGWSIHTYPIMPGTHTFKWKNNGGGFHNNTHYIDYIICSD